MKSKERLSEAGEKRMVKGITLLFWIENSEVNYSMRHLKEKHMLSVSLLLSVTIFPVRGRVAVYEVGCEKLIFILSSANLQNNIPSPKRHQQSYN